LLEIYEKNNAKKIKYYKQIQHHVEFQVNIFENTKIKTSETIFCASEDKNNQTYTLNKKSDK